jgi:hypothetical protein
MDTRINEFVDGIKDEAFVLIKGEFKTFMGGLKERTDEFSQKNKAKIEKYLLQLSLGQITKLQFQDAMLDVEKLARMEANLEKVATKAAAQRIHEGVNKLVINGLIKAIPG